MVLWTVRLITKVMFSRAADDFSPVPMNENDLSVVGGAVSRFVSRSPASSGILDSAKPES
jgi:hypothetical protein